MTSEAPQSRWNRWRARLPERAPWLSLGHPFVLVVLLVVVTAVLVLLVGPPLTGGRIRLQENSVAKRDYRATRTFDYEAPDPAAEVRAREATARVPRVYRYDGAVREAQLATLEDVFQTLRTLCEEQRKALADLRQSHERELAALMAAVAEAPDEAAAAHATARAEAARRELDEALQRATREHDTAMAGAVGDSIAKLGAGVSPDSLETLSGICFPDGLRRKASSLLGWILEENIVEEKAELATEIERGIDVIHTDEDALQHVVDLDVFLSRNEAQGRVSAAARRLFNVRREPRYYDDTRVESAFVDLVTALVVPTTRYDAEATRAARTAARAAVRTTQTVTIHSDQILVRKGQIVTPEHASLLDQMQVGEPELSKLRPQVGTALIVLLFLGLTYLFGVRQVRGFRRRPKDVLLIATVLVAQVALLKITVGVTSVVTEVWEGVPLAAYCFAMPLAVGAMLVRLFVSWPTAMLYSLVLALLAGILVDGSGVSEFQGSAALYVSILATLTSLVGIAQMGAIRSRTAVLRAGLVVGVAQALLALGFCLLDSSPLGPDTATIALGGLLGGPIAALLVSAVAPALEWAFAYTTDVKLLELGNLNHPMLKKLTLEAPGTYYHSFVVGNLVESAAESIHANPLLARVGAMYHDIGKLKNPQYFGENQRRDNPHDRMPPAMSALIIRAHVKDSVRVAEETKLGREIRDVIQQHHGTTLLQCFYEKAVEAAVAIGAPAPSESEFRYPGPKPQSREAALVMLADSVEAAVRSLREKSPSRIQGMVHRIVLDKFTDGQLDECDLTLRDLNQIEEIFTKVLQGVYHGRPEYPDRQRTSTSQSGKILPLRTTRKKSLAPM